MYSLHLKKYVTFFIIFCILYLHFFFNIKVQAQHYSFRTYGLEEGLPQSEVWDMISDKRGYLWAGTNGGGLARFNGKHFQVFTKKHGLIDEQVRNLFEDSKGNLWISTFRGLSVYDGRTFKNYTQKDGVINSTFAQFIEDEKGRIWVYQFQNQNDRALLRFDDGKIENLLKTFSPTFGNGNLPTGIFQDRQKRVYTLSVQKGLLVYEHEKWQTAPLATHPKLKNKPAIALLCHDSQDRMWFLTAPLQGNPNEVELFYAKNDSITKIEFPDCPSNIIVHVREDSKRNIWFASFSRGAVCYKPDNSFQHFNQENSLLNNFLNVTTEDIEGNTWFSSRGKGIICFDKGRFVSISEKDGLKAPIVRSFFEDNKGLMWFGTAGGGIASFNGKNLTTYFENDQIIGRVKALDTTDTGKMLIASDAGLLVMEGNQYTKVNAQFGLPDNVLVSYVCRVLINGEIQWAIGTFNLGFFIYNPKTKKSTNYQANNSEVRHNYTHSIMQDSKKRVWVCTNAGLICYENEKLVRYDKKHQLQNDLVLQACEDKNGRIWVGTYGEGIAYLDENKQVFVHTTPRHSNIASSVIYSLILDNDNNMWAGTQKGVDKITFDKNGNIIHIKNYDSRDGFTGLECNGAANYKDKNGNIWFGTIKGAIKYNPKEENDTQKPPLLNITQLRLFFREIDWQDKTYKPFHKGLTNWFKLPQKLVLPYAQNHITIDFEAISFQSSEKIRYQWKLEGLDKDWTPETEKTEAEYPNLPAGTYTFLVKASNAEGLWSETVSYKFTILPPWYLTWWAIIGFVVVVAGAITLLIFWRIKALKAYQKHLEKLVKEKTVEVTKQNIELKQQKEEITMQAENLKYANLEITRKQQEITDSITYAKHIQEAILPQPQYIQDILPQSFVLFKPRDIVSGDFYWFEKISTNANEYKLIIAVADCTGHGVPGAFMSMIGNELLHEIVKEKHITSPEKILYQLHIRIRQALKQEETNNRDGMDIAIITIDYQQKIFQYAGAKSRILYAKNNMICEIKGDKMPIGGEQTEIERLFTLHNIPFTDDMKIYMFSDGYIDQFGGKNGKKFMISQFQQLLENITQKPMHTQQEILENTLQNWIAEAYEEQIDDITVLGIKI